MKMLELLEIENKKADEELSSAIEDGNKYLKLLKDITLEIINEHTSR
jgi:hypothetical protein